MRRYAIIDAAGAVIDTDYSPFMGLCLAQLASACQTRMTFVPMKNGLSLCVIRTYGLTEQDDSGVIVAVNTTTEAQNHSVPGVSEAIEAWTTARVASGLSPRYMRAGRNSLLRLAEACGWTRLSQDVQGDAERYLAAIPNAKTRNNAVVHLRRVLEYAKKRGWVAENWARHIELARVKTRRRRQAYTDAQYEALIRVARESEAKGRASRSLGYMLAWHCGLRRGEVERLEWADVRLDADPPHVRIPGAKGTRRGDDQHVPIVSRDLTDALRAAQAAAKGTKVFPGRLPHNREARCDTRRAGIPYVNDWGEVSAPWHSLRHGFCTRPAATGVNAQTAQILMRHRSIQQTIQYTNGRMTPQVAALRSLEDAKNKSTNFVPAREFPLDKRREMSDDAGVMTVETEKTREAQVDARRHHKTYALNVLPGQFTEAVSGSDSHVKHPRQDSNLPGGYWAQVLHAVQTEQRLADERLDLIRRLAGGRDDRVPGRDR